MYKLHTANMENNCMFYSIEMDETFKNGTENVRTPMNSMFDHTMQHKERIQQKKNRNINNQQILKTNESGRKMRNRMVK